MKGYDDMDDVDNELTDLTQQKPLDCKHTIDLHYYYSSGAVNDLAQKRLLEEASNCLQFQQTPTTIETVTSTRPENNVELLNVLAQAEAGSEGENDGFNSD